MSAVEDFSRYVDTPKCICSHHRAFHQDYSAACLFWNECGCLHYHADSDVAEPDSVVAPPSVFSSYDGQYKPKGGYRL